MSNRFKMLRREVSSKYEKKSYARTVNLFIINELYSNFKRNLDQGEDNKNHFFLNPDQFAGDDLTKFNNFTERIEGNTDLFLKNEETGDYVCTKKLENILKDSFIAEYNENKIERDSDFLNRQENEDSEINNIFSLLEFKREHPKNLLEFDKKIEKEHVYLPSSVLLFHNIHTLINKDRDFKFILNPKITLSKRFDLVDTDKVVKIEIDILKKIHLNDMFGEKLISKYKFRCPNCGGLLELLPYELFQTIKHGCPDYYDNNGNQKYFTIKPEGKEISNLMNVYLYEVKLLGNDDTFFIYSFEKNLCSGRYIVDLFTTISDLKGIGTNYLFLILGYQQQIPKVNTVLLSNKEAKDWCNKRRLPYIKMLDTPFSIQKMYRDYTLIPFNSKGMLLQMFITISALSKFLFSYNKLGISVIGNKSLGKTYVGRLFGQVLDPKFEYIQSALDVSYPGLKGGINNKKMVNGQIRTLFEQGIFTTAGIALFDEGENFYLDKQLNSSLKNLPDTKINIRKIGGESVEQNYTPLIFSNIYSFHRDEYMREVINVYYSIISKKQINRDDHGNKKSEIIYYLKMKNLFLPLSNYIKEDKNPELAEAIFYVRESFRNSQRDWKTGGDLATSYRLLFDVICWNEEIKVNTDNKRTMKDNALILPKLELLPYHDFMETIKLWYDPKNKKINLFDLTRNSEEVNNQLILLKNDINEFILNEGKDIHTHLADNRVQIDDKLSSIMVTAIMVLQLTEDMDSIRLSENIKVWCNVLLLKCKRGILQSEYDLSTPKKRFTYIDYDFDKIDTELEEFGKTEQAKLDAKALLDLKTKSDQTSNIGVDINEAVFDNVAEVKKPQGD